MNREFVEFIKKNNIDIESLEENLTIYNESDINYIISNNKIEGPEIQTKISLADIIGYDYSWRTPTNNLVGNFSSFFANGTTYQSRSLGMLEYSSADIIEKLSLSFQKEPIRVLELDNGKKIISGNGLHRYTLLRLHYLGELQKVKGDKTKEKLLRKKYEIPVKLKRVDLLKTYCQFLINKTSIERIRLYNHYDENHNITSKTEVEEDGKTMIFEDKELIAYTKERIRSMSQEMKQYFVSIVGEYEKMYDSFKLFVDTYFSEELSLLISETTKKERGV